jgi:hypothetical protein
MIYSELDFCRTSAMWSRQKQLYKRRYVSSPFGLLVCWLVAERPTLSTDGAVKAQEVGSIQLSTLQTCLCVPRNVKCIRVSGFIFNFSFNV